MTNEEAIELLKEYASRIKPFYEPYRTEYPQAIDMAIKALSTEAEEVVRCEDCKWHLNGHLCKQLSHHYGSIETPPSFYCGLGERREP